MKKVLIIILSILLVGSFGFCTYWTIANFDKVKKATDGTKLYTHEDIEKSFDDGYNQGLSDKSGYQDEISKLKADISAAQDKILTYESKIKELNTTIALKDVNELNYQQDIVALNLEISALRADINALYNDIEVYETTISSLENENVCVVRFFFKV